LSQRSVVAGIVQHQVQKLRKHLKQRAKHLHDLLQQVIDSLVLTSLAATAGLVVWCVAPFLVVTMPLGIFLSNFGQTSSGIDRMVIKCSTLLSPASIIPFNEFDSLGELGEPWRAVLANFACYAVLLVAVRAACLRNADRWLGRSANSSRPLAADPPFH